MGLRTRLIKMPTGIPLIHSCLFPLPKPVIQNAFKINIFLFFVFQIWSQIAFRFRVTLCRQHGQWEEK